MGFFKNVFKGMFVPPKHNRERGPIMDSRNIDIARVPQGPIMDSRNIDIARVPQGPQNLKNNFSNKQLTPSELAVIIGAQKGRKGGYTTQGPQNLKNNISNKQLTPSELAVAEAAAAEAAAAETPLLTRKIARDIIESDKRHPMTEPSFMGISTHLHTHPNAPHFDKGAVHPFDRLKNKTNYGSQLKFKKPRVVM